MEHKIMNTELHVVRIINEKPFGSNGTWKDEWIWEVVIADANSDENVVCYGKAISNKPNKEIPWIELKTIQPLDEIIEMCKYQMKS